MCADGERDEEGGHLAEIHGVPVREEESEARAFHGPNPHESDSISHLRPREEYFQTVQFALPILQIDSEIRTVRLDLKRENCQEKQLTCHSARSLRCKR